MSKQEIIDYIKKHFEDNDILIKMIKDLKPKVKKLEWRTVSDEREGYRIVCKAKDYTIHTNGKQYFYRFFSDIYYNTLEEAKDACQKHYEETILNALEQE
jgi:hypothetical protein